MTSEDRAERENLLRLRRFMQLRHDIDEAARVAAAYGRLELQLHYAPVSISRQRPAR
jgi:hypothetical protein